MIAMKALPKALLFAPRSAHRLWPLLALLAAGAVGPAQALRIKEVAAGQGVGSNQVTRSVLVGGGGCGQQPVDRLRAGGGAGRHGRSDHPDALHHAGPVELPATDGPEPAA